MLTRRIIPILSVLILLLSVLLSVTALSAKASEPGGRSHHEATDEQDHAVVPDPVVVATPNPNCALIVPAHPLSAVGLATPYQLTATDRNAGACHETDPVQAAFVEAAVLNPATGAIGIYHPLVIDKGDTPAFAPSPVVLPASAVVAIWFGSNGDTLTLRGRGAESCVNGTHDSIFGQFAFCNAPSFFQQTNRAIRAGKLVVPPLGVASDGLPCPTTRDFMVVDQDQSDNVATTYRLIAGKLAQNTATTRAAVGSTQANGSDERLLASKIDPALGCKPFTAPDLNDPGSSVSALALNELSAAAHQVAPAALVPLNDPMTLRDGERSVRKTNLYRSGVDQPQLPVGQTPREYCRDLSAARVRVVANALTFTAAASPTVGINLADFLSARYTASLSSLGCAVAPRDGGHHTD